MLNITQPKVWCIIMAVDLAKIEDSSKLLDLLISCEDILDSSDVYSFLGWNAGEIIKGPIVRRHWVSMSLLYPYRKMPDPRASLRLLKIGVKVDFARIQREPEQNAVGVNTKDESKEAKESNTFWMITLTFPRHLLDITADDLEIYDDEIDADDVESAEDSGLDSESAYQTDEQEGDMGQSPMEDPNAPSQAQPQGGSPNVPF